MALIDLAPHNMTANNAPAPFVASASSEYSGDFAAWKAFQGGLGTNAYWIGTGNGVDWLKLYIYSPKTLYSYTLYANTTPEATRMPKNFTMEGSIDNSNWVVLDTRTNETAWGSGEGRNYVCQTPSLIAFTYYKLDVTANNGDTYTQVGELYLYNRILYNYLHARRNRLDMKGISVPR